MKTLRTLLSVTLFTLLANPAAKAVMAAITTAAMRNLRFSKCIANPPELYSTLLCLFQSELHLRPRPSLARRRTMQPITFDRCRDAQATGSQ